MVGGGKGAFIGDVHRRAIALDGLAELVAGSFSQSFENTLETGASLGFPAIGCMPHILKWPKKRPPVLTASILCRL
jgi:hypothetical protein